MEEESAAISTTSWESDLVGAATVGNYLPIKRWVDNTLRIPCEEVKRCSPMNASLAGKMLRIAALNGKLAVVDLLRSYAYVNERGNEFNQEWTALHCAVMGFKQNSVKQSPDRFVAGLSCVEDDQLLIIFMLHESGAQVTVECDGDTPLTLALDPEVKFYTGAVLLEKLQQMQCKTTPGRINDIPESVYLNCVHNLVQWATVRQYTNLVMHILKQYKGITKLVNKFLQLNSNEATVFHIVAEIGNYNFMCDLADVCRTAGITPEQIANWQCKHILPSNPENGIDKIEMYQTPLSLAIGKDNLAIIDAIKVSDGQLCSVTYLSLSNVCIKTIPLAVFTFPCLKVLDLSKNMLRELPLDNSNISEIKVVDINLSHNRFVALPEALFALPMIESIKAASNALANVPNNWWKACKLQRLDLSGNRIVTIGREPTFSDELYFEDDNPATATIYQLASSHVEFRLQQRATLHSVCVNRDNSVLTVLRLNDNMIELFPRGLACLTPKLESLHLVNNSIRCICPIEELPPKLRILDVSQNYLTSQTGVLFQPGRTTLPCFRAPKQSPVYCHHMIHRKLFNLGSLNFSHNELHTLTLFDQDQNSLFPKLFSLNISHNKFNELPLQLYRFTELRLLNISHNPTVQHIPLDIGNISSLIDLEYNNINDPLVETLDTIPSIVEKLTYLRTLQQSSEKNSIIRLMIVGPSGHGKTTLLSNVKSKSKAIPQPVTFLDRQLSYSVNASAVLSKSFNSLSKSDLQSTVGIDIDNFFYDDCSAMSQKVVFSAWDFAGQEEYFITHHCFVSPGAVYVVCCKTEELFNRGASILLPWLAMIKAKAPGSPILVVGTFIDKLPRKLLKQCDTLRIHIMEHFASPFSSLQVEIEDVIFVECSSRKKRPCIAMLRRKLYESAFNVVIPPGPNNRRNHSQVAPQQKLLHQLVPTVYTDLHKKLAATAAHIRRHLSTQQPVFTWDELKDNASDIIEDEMELHSAVEYLKRNGSLIHFDSDGLQHLYFIDPQWLIDKLALVVTTPNRSILYELSGQQHPEIIDTRSLMKCLFEYGFLPVFQDAFCELLARFELAIPIGDGSRLFFPSLLLTHSEFHYFKMHYSFPRNCDNDSLESELTESVFGNQVTAENSLSAPINVMLRPTGLCYRRFFVLTVVPIPLWPRLISRCLTTFKFLDIIKKNCVSSLQFQLFQEFGKTRVGNTILEWIYWMNGIELRLSNATLLQISSVDFTRCGDCDAESISMQTHMKNVFISNGNQWLQLSSSFTGGLEVVVPEYLLLSAGSCPGQSMVSNSVSAQIFTHCIEVIDEIFVEWFTSSSSGSDLHAVSRYLVSFTPCPICAGDKDHRNPGHSPPPSPPPFEISMSQRAHSASVESIRSGSRSQGSVSSWFARTRKPRPIFDLSQPEMITQVNKLGFRYIDSSDTIGPNPVGFTIMHCLWIAQYQNYVYCPKHGKLELMYLAPDLVYADAKDFIIPNDQLSQETEVIGQGGFGKILKKRLKIRKCNQTFDEVVAIKILADQNECTPENILHQYNDSRRELNMIYGLDHERIVRFYGITLQPVGFVMEWAGLGSLDDVIKGYHSHGVHVCPDAVFAITKQVVTGLGYLHGLNIVHFDLKPQNILIFKFPRETHCCYPQSDEAMPTSRRCLHCYNDAGIIDGVVIKLADLGISVRKGPRGFVRSCATPGHTAPEALLHRGLKHLDEKVDIFSLGMCMYETMSLALVPPKEYNMFEFDEEIKNGIRPGFLEKDPRYPVFLYDCMTSCWDQNPQIRPSTNQLLEVMTPMKLQLVDFFVFDNYKITDIQCSCVVYSKENDEESLWLSMNEQGGMTTLLVVKFQVQESKVISKVISPISFIGKVIALCQVQQFVYVILEGLKVATIHSQTFEQLDMVDNPFSTAITSDLCAACYIDKLHVLLVAFKCGNIGILRLPHNGFNLTELTSQFQYEVISSIGKKCAQVHHLNIDCHFICMEQVVVNGDTDELWFGCDNDTIVTLPLEVLMTESTPEVHSPIRNVSGNSNCPCKVVQLKSVEMFRRQLVYALLDVGMVVCYDVSVAVQNWQCLKQIPIPKASVMLVHGTKLFLGTKLGKIFYLNMDTLITDKVNTHQSLLCAKHQHNQPVFDLVTITGELSSHNFLRGLGTRIHRQLHKHCKVMLSIGGGYTELLPASEPTMNLLNNELCMIATLL